MQSDIDSIIGAISFFGSMHSCHLWLVSPSQLRKIRIKSPGAARPASPADVCPSLYFGSMHSCHLWLVSPSQLRKIRIKSPGAARPSKPGRCMSITLLGRLSSPRGSDRYMLLSISHHASVTAQRSVISPSHPNVCMSQAGDTPLAALLDRLRLGELTSDDVKALNARDINNPSLPIPTFSIGSDVSTGATAFANNAPRVLYNPVITAAKARSGITVYCLLADCRRRGVPCHNAYLRECYRLPEHLTGVPCPGMGRVHRHKNCRHLQQFNDPWNCYLPSTFLPAQLSLC